MSTATRRRRPAAAGSFEAYRRAAGSAREILPSDRRWRTRPPRRCSRTRQDADDPLRRRGDASRLPPHPVHPRPDALRHHRHGDNWRKIRRAGTVPSVFAKGPIFANIILADEINRAPPRTQAALLEAMQEHRVTAAGETMSLPEPFFVLATQNPIEQEGTYPLPEAQLDRFLFDIRVGYPSADEEGNSPRDDGGSIRVVLAPVLDGALTHKLARLVREVPARRSCASLCGEHRARDAPRFARRDSSRQAIRALGRWAARGTGTDPGRKGFRTAQWTLRSFSRRHPSGRASRTSPSHSSELRRRSGRSERRAHHRRAAPRSAGAEERHQGLVPRGRRSDCTRRQRSSRRSSQHPLAGSKEITSRSRRRARLQHARRIRRVHRVSRVPSRRRDSADRLQLLRAQQSRIHPDLERPHDRLDDDAGGCVRLARVPRGFLENGSTPGR